MEFISIDGLRGDGRRPIELRRINCEVGSAANADGSACVSMGLSKASLSTCPVSRKVNHLAELLQ